jgi:hypothetical protein
VLCFVIERLGFSKTLQISKACKPFFHPRRKNDDGALKNEDAELRMPMGFQFGSYDTICDQRHSELTFH